MRHLSPRLAAREVLLLPPLVVGPPGLAVLVLRPGPLHPLPPGHRRARRTVDVAPVTGATDAHRPPAPRAREPPRLGRRHRPGVPRALHLWRFARPSIWLTVDRATAAVTRRPGISPRASTLSGHLVACHSLGHPGNCSGHLRWVTSDEHTPGVSRERRRAAGRRRWRRPSTRSKSCAATCAGRSSPRTPRPASDQRSTTRRPRA